MGLHKGAEKATYNCAASQAGRNPEEWGAERPSHLTATIVAARAAHVPCQEAAFQHG